MKIENLGSYELDIINDIAHHLVSEVDRMYLINGDVELSEVLNAFLKVITEKETK